MIDKLVELMGRPLQDPEVKQFLADNDFKYPKRETISNQTTETSFWIENKKKDLMLTFNAEIQNPKYPPVPAERKGMFLPLLFQASFGPKSKDNFPFGLRGDMNLEEIKKIMHKFNFKDVTPLQVDWLIRWEKIFDKKKDIYLQVDYFTGKDCVRNIMLTFDWTTELILFCDGLQHKFEDFPKNKITQCDLFFLWWIIKNDFLKETKQNKEGIKKIKAGKITIVDFIKEYIGRNYLRVKEVLNEDFLNIYAKNRSGNEKSSIYFAGDFNKTFLKGKKVKDYKEGDEILNNIELNEENYKKVESFINQRNKEFKAHKLLKSKKL